MTNPAYTDDRVVRAFRACGGVRARGGKQSTMIQDGRGHYDPHYATLRRAYATVAFALVFPVYIIYFVNTIRQRKHLSIMQVGG